MADVILWKGIKPTKLRIDAVRLTLLNELRAVGVQVRKDFEATTATWKEKPKFEQEIGLSPDGPTLLVGTDDENYNRLDKGTRKNYPIPKAGPGLLAFRPGYVAKTSPGVIGSQAGGPFGDFVIRHTQIIHPGIEARKFGETIQKKWEKPFKRRMEVAIKKAAKNSGWGKK